MGCLAGVVGDGYGELSSRQHDDYGGWGRTVYIVYYQEEKVQKGKGWCSSFLLLQRCYRTYQNQGQGQRYQTSRGQSRARGVCRHCHIQVCASVRTFYAMSLQVAKVMSHPTIIVKGKDREGNVVLVDDYRQAYVRGFVLALVTRFTPEDARIMAWWDYGYQITGIANRTTLADGTTWNHEHIALLGRTLTTPEKDAHRIARHLAEYVLVWAGGGGDDVAKSPHLRRITNSVYRGLCGEPMCRDFGFLSNRVPSEDLGNSLLYKLVNHKLVAGVEADKNRFREVYTSKHEKVRIFKIQSVSKESKEWVIENRKCDAPGSWFCPGTYPPKLQTVLKEKKDFKQLEDFNTDGNDDKYKKQYFEHLHKKGSSPLKAPATKDKFKLCIVCMKRLLDVSLDFPIVLEVQESTNAVISDSPISKTYKGVTAVTECCDN